jgi:uncharacterized membrane protein
MNQRQIGIALIIIGVLMAAFVTVAKLREDSHINAYVAKEKTCFLDDGTCLHAASGSLFYIFGGVISAAIIILGVYLVFFDKTQQMLATQGLEISAALKEAKVQEKAKDEFGAYLAAFNPDEQKVIKAVREQDGIEQSTLRYRTGITKSSLSLLLQSLEGREVISRKPAGKTNKVYLRKKF